MSDPLVLTYAEIEALRRDAARYRYLASTAREVVLRVSRDGPWHLERHWAISFIGGDDNDEPLRDIGSFVDEEIERISRRLAAAA